MYTLRTFKDKGAIDRDHVYIGDAYSVREPTEENIEKGIKLWVFGNWDSVAREGIAIFNDDYAFIMTALGGTFEVLNRPKEK